MLSGEEFWCQLFSEPASGSDLANLGTRAVRDGDEFVVNGQKIWTSGAQFARFGILIARTDPDVAKHRGISYFICPMDAPGIEIRPIAEMTGGHTFNEVFFTDVRIPHENIIGQIDAGWGPMMTTLSNERTLIGGATRGDFTEIADLARRTGAHKSPVLRQQLARSYTRSEILKFLGYRVRTAAARGVAPGPESSIISCWCPNT